MKELSASPEGVGVTWLEGRSLSNGQQLSFHPFADLGRAWAGITDDDDEGVARAKLEAGVRVLLPDQAEEVFPFLATLVGLRREGDRLHLAPCLPADWPGFGIHYRFRASTYQIEVSRAPADAEAGSPARSVTLDGELQQGGVIALTDDRREHRVVVVV